MKKLLFCLFVFILCNGYSQNYKKQKQYYSTSIEDKLSFYLLDVEDGLSNDGINSITQDSLGFIWVGTPEGVNRYDGTQFEVFKKSNRLDIQSISDNFIYQVSYIGEEKLFIATSEGLNIYNQKEETFNLLELDNKLLGNNISCFSYGPQKQIILGIYNLGVQIIEGNKKSVYSYSSENQASLSSNEILSIAHQGDSLIWVGTIKDGLNKINYKTNQVDRIKLNENIYSLRINALYVDKEDNLWVGSNDGIYVLKTNGDKLHLDKALEEGNGLSDNNVLCFEEDSSGQLWIGTRNGGLNILNKSSFLNQKNDFLVKWYLPRDDGSSVFNRTVSALKKDRDGNMWIGTSTGLNFVNPQVDPVKLLRVNKLRDKSLAHDRIGALAESTEGKIWIGTDGAGLDLFDANTGKFKHYKHVPNDSSSLSNNYIISLFEDSKKRLWVGTYQAGLNKMNISTEKCKHYLQGNIAQGSDVRVVFEDSKGEIFVGTNRGGLYKYEEDKDQFEFVNPLGKLDIRDISEDSRGYFWLATYGDGIIRYKPNTNEIIYYNSSNVKDFKTDVIFSILVLPNGDILAGTQNEGLIRLNPSEKRIINFTEDNGLSNNTITSIVMDNEESIWLGTFKGISNYNSLTNRIYNLNTYTNIQQSKFNIGAGLITRSGVVYLGGDKGLNIFKPDNLKKEKEKHPIIFEKLEVLDRKALDAGNKKNGVLDRSILYEDHIYLNYNQTFFSIDYVTLKYPFVKNTNYSYRIDGYHNNWINTNNAGKVNLINIPHGEYTLNVKAKFGSGDEVTKKLDIIISPPFWRTPLAYIIYLVLLVISIYAFMKYYSERIKLINSLLFEKKQRQLEYNFNEERIRFFTSFSHELKTPLTLILAPLEDLILQIKSIKQKNSLLLIQKNAKHLLQSINKLLEFRKSNLGLSKLRVGEHNLTSCLEQWVHSYFPLAKKRDIALSYDFPEEALFAWFDLEKMHIIFNNLLSNAFKYTQDKGEIHVSLSFDEEYFEIKVKDTGYGIGDDELEHVFERYYQSNTTESKNGLGIGLALSKNFTELHMGSIHIESKLNVGSVFSIVIPRDKSLFTNAIIDTNQEERDDVTFDLGEWDTLPKLQTKEKKTSNLILNDSKELVLLIDDNPDILTYLDELLEGKYDLIYANNGEEGVEKALRYVPDLIVSDVMMPKMSGIELCNALKDTIETTHIPIILLTAKGNTENIQEGYTHGADDYIVKPFSGQVLQTRIRNLLDSRKKLRDYFLKKKDVKIDIINENLTLLDQEKSFLNELEQVILNHLDDEKMDVWVVAKGIGMSRTSLFRKIKAITGLNINQYIRKVKIDKAAQLIKGGNYTVAQASYEVGFNNVKYFRKLFKKQFGQLPSELSRKKD